MDQFKIMFPSGFCVKNLDDDNIDVNVILPNGFVYFGTLFTLLNIRSLMKNSDELYFWATDMIIVKDLKKETIRSTIFKIIEDGYLEMAFSKIGTIKDIYTDKNSYDEIDDTL